jgi:hypothetical protein
MVYDFLNYPEIFRVLTPISRVVGMVFALSLEFAYILIFTKKICPHKKMLF